MDPQVEKALAKWPNVPHCYGWLALDARGNWRMRDAKAQQQGLPGEHLAPSALTAFINRNYGHDELGRWYFQNGPQRVYVDLEAAPHVARLEPDATLRLHTGAALPRIGAAWLSDRGRIWLQGYLQGDELVALLDDRDLAPLLSRLHADGQPATEAQLMAWLDRDATVELTLDWSRMLPVGRLLEETAASRFGFVRVPRGER